MCRLQACDDRVHRSAIADVHHLVIATLIPGRREGCNGADEFMLVLTQSALQHLANETIGACQRIRAIFQLQIVLTCRSGQARVYAQPLEKDIRFTTAKVCFDHHAAQLFERGLGIPAQN